MNINRVDSTQPGKVNGIGAVHHVQPVPSVTDYQSEEIQKRSDFYNEQTKEEQAKFEEQIKKLNESIASSGKELHFKYNDEAKQLYVEVLDSQTKEVLTSLPPEFLIDLSMKMKELVGVFFDKKI
ncbi:flagellar protein FlaG [Paenibacillus durus]|uniref:flagellar protein FlaG n=1 Tax=Paenibacillus durus TaxID=44251 RepID=UPI0004728541|nr:flagellar protein FlaG [Paenibacillus durus]